MARTGIHPYKYMSCDHCQQKPTRNRSRWCMSCAKRQQLTRDPAGKMPRRAVITPWRQRASRAMRTWGMQYEPEVLAMIAAMRDYLNTKHPHAGTEKQLRMMRNFDADPLHMLIRFMGLQGLYHFGTKGDTMHTDHVYWCALGRCVQRAVSLPARHPVTGRRSRAPEGSGLVAEKIGHDLSSRIGAASLALWARIEDEENVRLSDQRKTIDVIARRPDLAVLYPDSKSRRRFARECNAQRRALCLQMVAEQVQSLPVVATSTPSDDVDDFDADAFMQQLESDRA